MQLPEVLARVDGQRSAQVHLEYTGQVRRFVDMAVQAHHWLLLGDILCNGA